RLFPSTSGGPNLTVSMNHGAAVLSVPFDPAHGFPAWSPDSTYRFGLGAGSPFGNGQAGPSLILTNVQIVQADSMTISGHVLSGTSPVSGATVTVGTNTTTTDSSGFYSVAFSDLNNLSGYNVSCTASNLTFTSAAGVYPGMSTNLQVLTSPPPQLFTPATWNIG